MLETQKNFLIKKYFIISVGLLLRIVRKFDFELRPALVVFILMLGVLNLMKLSNYSLDDIMGVSRRRSESGLLDSLPLGFLLTQEQPSQKLEVVVPTNPPEKLLRFSSPEKVLAKSYIIYDNLKEREIYNKDKNLQLPPASLVKMLSSIYLAENVNLDTMVSVPANCTVVQGQKIGFKPGELVSIKDLLYSTLIFSGGDSVCAMAFRNADYSIQGLNNKAKEIGLNNSNFTNYIGLDFEGNSTTSSDMLTLTKYFIKNNLFNEIVSLKSYKLSNGKVILNTNKALSEIEGTIGVKTGTTEGANENLIYRLKNEDRDLIIVLLNSSDRYSDIKNILADIYLE
ncbi:D-alanyl-D-alanine carboxypeptidase [bacterium]|nr:D-alanyl-D-alanine carboxypeptidase [bacterium]